MFDIMTNSAFDYFFTVSAMFIVPLAVIIAALSLFKD